MSGNKKLVGYGLIAAGGAYTVYNLTDANTEEYDKISELADEVEEAIGEEIEYAGELPENQLEHHKEKWKSTALTEYDKLSSDAKDSIESPSSIEEQLSGEDLETQSFGWKVYAESILVARERELAEEVDDDGALLSPEMYNLMRYGLGAASVLGLPYFASRILEEYNKMERSARDLSLMAQSHFIEETIDAEETPVPQAPPNTVTEEPQSGSGEVVSDVTVSEAMGQMSGEALSLFNDILDVSSDSAVVVTEVAVDLLAQMTNKSADWFLSLSTVELAMILLLVVAIGIAITSPEAISTGTGMALSAAQQAITGVRINLTILRQILPQLQRASQVGAAAI